ncbi:MAG: choice-of-anchor E domain-containing protein [Proteobacteria bacterium]|nr:choice-of-anchor E domain-containing protein [Pseudomonadota bacterium]
MDASAATLPFTSDTFAPSTISTTLFGPQPESSTAVTGLSQFNAALGTLTQIDLTVVNYVVSGQAEVVNAGSEGASASLTADFSVEGTTANAKTSGSGSAVVPFGFGPPPQALTLAAGAFPALTLTDALDLAPFIGIGDVSLFAKIKNFNFSGSCRLSGSCSFQASAAFSGQVHVVYTYTPADVPLPEPASIAVIGAGLAGITAFRRRRRAA